MKSVRTWFVLMLLVALSAGDDEALPEALPEDIKDPPEIKTSNGLISGMREESTKGKVFYSYYGIPFAKPPIGDLRFKNPSKVGDWEGVRECTSWPPKCPQFKFPTTEYLGEEDCLYLNIFTPKPTEETARLPVMIFIHGGAFMLGSSRAYAPYVMMNHEIIFVTLQYRVGMLGFLSTEDDEAPGNLGLKDQTMAMSWVQSNIHLFGGDPVGITLFGESAGAASVHFQMLSPRSVGFFQRAIIMSGTALAPFAKGGAFKEVAEYIGKVFNCTTNEGSEKLIKCLQNIPVEDLVPVQQHFTVWFLNPIMFAPRVDGDYLPKEPELLMKDKRHKRLDLMAGITTHEGALYSIPVYANEAYRAAVMLNFPEMGPVTLDFGENDVEIMKQTVKIYDHYLKGVNLDAFNADNLTRMFSDRYFTVPHDLTTSMYAENVKRFNKKVYTYELSYRGQRSFSEMYGVDIGQHYVSHGDDLLYFFNGGIFRDLETEDDLKMRDLLTTMWTNFATYGDPTPDDSLGFKWELFTKENMTHLNINLSPTMEQDSRSEVRDFWASLPLNTNLILDPDRVTNLTVTAAKEGSGEETSEAEQKLTSEEVKVSEGAKEESAREEEEIKEELKKDEL